MLARQELFLWQPVKGIQIDIPSSPTRLKQFSLSSFETPKDGDATPYRDEVVSMKAVKVCNYVLPFWFID